MSDEAKQLLTELVRSLATPFADTVSKAFMSGYEIGSKEVNDYWVDKAAGASSITNLSGEHETNTGASSGKDIKK